MTCSAICVESEERSVDCLRLLTQSQDDISPSDMSEVCRYYNGSVEGVELMVSQGLIRSDLDTSDREDHFPLLAIALRLYGANHFGWESFLRRLLRKRTDLHAPVSREVELPCNLPGGVYPCKVLGHGTPLDDLFARIDTPFEGEAAAARWLQILSSEGYDVTAYLEEESRLHETQMQLTHPSYRRSSERICFEYSRKSLSNPTP